MRRILLRPDTPGWSYDFTARALAQHLAHRFDLRIAYSLEEVIAEAPHVDLIVDMWWRGGLEQHYGRRVLKQVSSHRWAQRRSGSLSPVALTRRYLAPSAGVVVPSQRLLALLSGHGVDVALTPKGFHPETFFDERRRTGPLRVGWAGNAKHADKRFALLRGAWPMLDAVGPGTGRELTQAEMPAWYNAIDVITCASDAEGDPRPLIEGMACGCFPVTVDVGIVPELVRHGENGLIVERSAEAFRDALAWCAANLDFVRAAGRRNAEEMLTSRTWAHVAPMWGDAFDRAMEAA